MALKGDRQVDAVDISYFMNTASDNGVIVCVGTAGSGVAMDNLNNVAVVNSNSSGNRPLGMLLNEVVDIDQTRYQVNVYKDQMVIGDKVTVATKGWFVTNKLFGSPSGGQLALLTSSGTIMGVSQGSVINEAANPRIGRFRSGKDQNGYAKVYIDL